MSKFSKINHKLGTANPCTPVRFRARPPMFSSRPVLRVADVLQPFDDLAVEFFLNGDMGHRRGSRGAVPMFLAGRKPDHIARPDFLDRAALALRPAAASRDDQGLTQRMGVPRRSGARFKGDARAGDARRFGRPEQGIDCLLYTSPSPR